MTQLFISHNKQFAICQSRSASIFHTKMLLAISLYCLLLITAETMPLDGKFCVSVVPCKQFLGIKLLPPGYNPHTTTTGNDEVYMEYYLGLSGRKVLDRAAALPVVSNFEAVKEFADSHDVNESEIQNDVDLLGNFGRCKHLKLNACPGRQNDVIYCHVASAVVSNK